MMKLLERVFIKKTEAASTADLRKAYGLLSGAVGITINLLLGAGKALLGSFTGSMAIVADAINNITDAASSIATIIGFKLASKGSDEEHPFGHARAEYMTGVVISAMVIIVGVKLIENSWVKIMHPTEINESIPVMIFLAIFMCVKLWLFIFNRNLGKKISSSTLHATAIDSRNDVITTGVVLFSIIVHKLSGVNIDGFVGLSVALFIIYSGLSLVKETAAPLLGQPPKPETIREISEIVMNHPEVLSIHDLLVHDYGPGHIFASVHAEVDAAENFLVSHDVIDNIEQEVMSALGIMLVVHMDPIDRSDPEVGFLRGLLAEVLTKTDFVVGIHDLRIVKGPTHTNVIFDVVLTHARVQEKEAEAKRLAAEALRNIGPDYRAVINFDMDYANSIDTSIEGGGKIW